MVVESAVNYRKLLFFARTINRSPEDNVYQLLLLWIDNFLNHPDRSTGFVKDITEICKKYDLFDLFLSWATENHAMSYREWKCTLRNRISIFENSLWESYTENHSHVSLFHQTSLRYLHQTTGKSLPCILIWFKRLIFSLD